MEKTMITRALFYIVVKMMKMLAERKDNKIGIEIIEIIDETFHGGNNEN
ncbi:MAG: hypothetical protein ACRCU6_00075 [Fusobacteriaceae bacterium]